MQKEDILKILNPKPLYDVFQDVMIDYLKEGGFPAIALSHSKTDIIISYFNTIILKDVIQRFRIQNLKNIFFLHVI